MKISVFTGIVLLSGAGATFLQSDILAAEGVTKLGLHVAQHGYPNAEQCTLKNVAVRKEWFVEIIRYCTGQHTHKLQVCTP